MNISSCCARISFEMKSLVAAKHIKPLKTNQGQKEVPLLSLNV
jgi:hypothetical protein